MLVECAGCLAHVLGIVGCGEPLAPGDEDVEGHGLLRRFEHEVPRVLQRFEAAALLDFPTFKMPEDALGIGEGFFRSSLCLAAETAEPQVFCGALRVIDDREPPDPDRL